MRPQKIDYKPLPYPQSGQSAQHYFLRHGINKSAWAAAMGIERTTMEHLLSGTLKGKRGAAHEAAIKLGLKEQPDGK